MDLRSAATRQHVGRNLRDVTGVDKCARRARAVATPGDRPKRGLDCSPKTIQS
jgi:hypothetical protein